MKISFFYFTAIILFVVVTLTQCQAQQINHSSWDAILKKNVSSTGAVNYAGIKASQSQLDAYLQSLSGGISASASREEKISFWINAYNAFTVKLILDNYPVKSIKDIKGGKPWDYKFIKIGGQTYSLNNIEHDILRKDFFDSRLHFVLVCAAKSCPKLLDKAYIPQNLNAEMTNQANSFINNSAKNKISAGSAQISELFNWYKDDFLKVSGVNSIQDYLNKYSTTKVKSTTPIKYMTYDWSLND